MPLPHFLALVAAVTVAAALSVVAALMVGVPLTVLALGAALAALVAWGARSLRRRERTNARGEVVA